MISLLNGVSALNNAQTRLESAATRIAQGPASPDDMVDLIQARDQFGAGTKVIQTEDEMTRKLLDILG
jgi:flagellar hook protein FlgE